MPQDPYFWTHAADWAAARTLATAAVEREIQEGRLPGEYRDDGWYVARPTVTLHFPDPADTKHAELHLLALPLGRHLTAARRELTIPVRIDDPDFKESLDTLLECLQGPETHPVPFRLNGRLWCVDASLHLDLTYALLDLENAQASPVDEEETSS